MTGYREYCVRLYTYQLHQGLYFLHEHPQTATSWRVPCIERLRNSPLVGTVVAHQCAFGLTATDEWGVQDLSRNQRRLCRNLSPSSSSWIVSVLGVNDTSRCLVEGLLQLLSTLRGCVELFALESSTRWNLTRQTSSWPELMVK